MITGDQKIRFNQVFKTKINPFICQLGGFDVITFDEWIDPPEDKSTYDVALEKFGQQGVDLMKELINAGFAHTPMKSPMN